MAAWAPVRAAVLAGCVAAASVGCGRAAGSQEAADRGGPSPAVVTAPEPRLFLRTTHDLFEQFVQGAGTLRCRPPARCDRPLAMPPGTQLVPQPWAAAPDRKGSAGVMSVSSGSVNSEAALSFVLREGEAWEVGLDDVADRSRLRFEARALTVGKASRLEVAIGDPATARVERLDLDDPLSGGEASTAADLPLDGHGHHVVLSLRATRGDVAIGEARLLGPDPDDARHRWIVLVIGDALRADALEDPELSRGAPALVEFARQGRRYTGALTPGCHTRAAVWALMSGRDMMRIDPFLRGGVNPRFSGADLVYRSGNLFFTEYASARGYHSVFLGNNAFFGTWPAFDRIKLLGSAATGTDETIRALPWLFSRYQDERVVLLYYVSATHTSAETPARLSDRLGCRAKTGLDSVRCDYAAKVAHFDEALAAFEAGLARSGLAGKTLQILTADHGENLKDTSGIEAEANGTGNWQGVTRSHGLSCYADEVRTPLVLVGPDIRPSVVRTPVSTLDIAPTVLAEMRIPPAAELDGRVLPEKDAPDADRLFASYGFCTDSLVQGGTQFVHWLPDCGQRRQAADKRLLGTEDDLWTAGRRAETVPGVVSTEWRTKRWRWISDRIPTTALMFEVGELGAAELTITASGAARITDYGPSNSVYGLDDLEEVRRVGPSILRLRTGRYRGRFFVATRPPLAPVRVHLTRASGDPAPVLALAGPHQLPVVLDDIELDPERHPDLLVMGGPPVLSRESSRMPRLWWEPYSLQQVAAGSQVEGFGHVLREWGYIR